MWIFRSRTDKRRWSRRLVDDETRAFVDDFLDQTSEIFRTASGEFQLRGLCLDVFASAQLRDVRWLKSRGIDGEGFYRTELAPSWEGLGREEREARLDAFIELSHMLGCTEPSGQPEKAFLDILATVHLKVILLAWAHDRTYSYIDRLFNGPLQYREHRYRLAAGRIGPEPRAMPASSQGEPGRQLLAGGRMRRRTGGRRRAAGPGREAAPDARAGA